MNADKMVLTLSSDAARVARDMAAETGVSVAELVRRSLSVMRFIQALPPSEELVVRSTDGSLERIKFIWSL